MKKVGIVTLYKDNFGSILQAYSTYSFIKSLGYECNILQYQYLESPIDKLIKIPSVLYKCIRYKDYLKDRKDNKKNFAKEISLLDSSTKKKMDDFVKKNFKIQNCNSKNLRIINSKYDYFITGSDQIWNGYDDFRFLVFADKEKRIALAPSFGTDNIKDYYEKKVKKSLKGFDVISVREESGVRMIKDLTQKEAIRLPDPTILFTKKEWDSFAQKGKKKSKYILIHFLNKPNALAIKTINEYLKSNNCIAYCICNKYKEYEQLLQCQFISITPYDYVALINNAEYVFTDSFHSTLFSINLETQFFTFDRQYLHASSQRSRVIDLLQRVEMINRFILCWNSNIFSENLQLWSSDEVFEKDRKKIKKYIIKGLE